MAYGATTGGGGQIYNQQRILENKTIASLILEAFFVHPAGQFWMRAHTALTFIVCLSF